MSWEGTCPYGRAHVDIPKGDLDFSQTIGDFNDLVISGSTTYPYGTTEGFPYMHDSAGTLLPDTAHEYAECSNKGTCDRRTGVCDCLLGYDGAACQRASCPTDLKAAKDRLVVQVSADGKTVSRSHTMSSKDYNNVQAGQCSGHGTCESISTLAKLDGGNKYSLWDKDVTMGCNCDPG